MLFFHKNVQSQGRGKKTLDGLEAFRPRPPKPPHQDKKTYPKKNK
jgi:hypothetical protein